ncbi:MAG: hypothetical protein RLZZ611_2077 [Cyanobacteriota bacterium]|jgi:NAD-reducing hydrogenase small subunit
MNSGSLGAETGAANGTERRLRLATAWLSGCSGCHMAFLDLDTWLLELADWAEIVYSPVASDRKVYPDDVDVALVEGAVANDDNLALLLQVRARTRVLVSFGDCAIHTNVSGLRNPLGDPEAVLQLAYQQLADSSGQRPHAPGLLPELRRQVLPLHALVPVDVYLPGCPPDPGRIRAVLEALRRGAAPRLSGADQIRFG